MEITRTNDFRIRELIEAKEKSRDEKRIPKKSEFQYIFESECRNLGVHALSEWRI